MIKSIKFQGKDTDFFFAGCLHHRHNPKWPIPLWKMRGFNSSQEHDDFQIKKWNEVCNENSVVFLLGDTIFNDPTGDEFVKLFQRLRFKQVWAQAGNHFSGWLQNYKKTLKLNYPDLITEEQILFEVYPLGMKINSEKVIQFVPNYIELDINGLQICASHYAIRSWNKMASNSLMLHSHEHAANKESDWLTTDSGKIIDLGYENLLKYNNGAPISLDKLKKIMDKKAYKPEGHH